MQGRPNASSATSSNAVFPVLTRWSTYSHARGILHYYYLPSWGLKVETIFLSPSAVQECSRPLWSNSCSNFEHFAVKKLYLQTKIMVGINWFYCMGINLYIRWTSNDFLHDSIPYRILHTYIPILNINVTCTTKRMDPNSRVWYYIIWYWYYNIILAPFLYLPISLHPILPWGGQ